MEDKILEGVVIGATGGALAGITVYLIQFLHRKCVDCIESKRIRTWLQVNTSRNEWRSTRAIASWTNLPMERVQYLCSHDSKVKLSTGENEDVWALRSKIPEPTFE
ncbi:hypothetical protein I6N98_04650 [Spongiibacter nanhainus]|uniref:Uncharacterized protein n=1 Tax=Spongiibacter nanhainus TaxID=2794344 RepID=A0A7T4R2B6_9GAMM|nr:hypothetical protein [Spongiibacter nanhainus]QQD19149.1 hypothetical protein I6N98_04650 [Spongiibacter nanhainus]